MPTLRHIRYAALAAGGLFVAGGAEAQSMYGIDQRQAEQQQAIDRDMRNGQLTPGETARLEQGERDINRAQARAEADGRVSPQERQRIDAMTNREGREVYRDAHNDRTTSGRDGWGRQTAERDHDDRGGRPGDRGRDGWDRDANNRNSGHDRDGGGQRQTDGRDWGRDHNWNGGHEGWNRGGDQGGQHGQPSPTPQQSWNGAPGQNGWRQGTGSTASQGGNAGWQHNGGAYGGPGTAPATGTQQAWSGGQPRPVSYGGTPSNSGGAYGAGAYGGGGRGSSGHR